MTNEGLDPFGGDPSERSYPITRNFRLVFLSVLGLTILSLGVCVYLIMFLSNPPDEARGLIATCSTTWKMGFGAVLGLLGGKKFS